MPKWLEDAVFYEVYPQSFNDTNGDGIGDIDGITEKLDYIKDLGCNAIWINPCYDSPFKDGGYDVRDYKKVAPRYGTNSDLYRLFGEAHKRDMHILLDLVPGHTSEEHKWFRESQKQERNEYSDRYVWADHCFRIEKYPYVAGESQRDGIYMLNFYKCQPALNYGFFNPTEPWQMSYKDPECQKTKEAMKDVMRFWLDRGCDGFRVDMANYLVKGEDENRTGTCAIWKDVRKMLDKDYPEAALVSEWANPKQSLSAGFHMDFLLNNPGTGYSTLMRDYSNSKDNANTSGINQKKVDATVDRSFFKRDGNGDIMRFLDDYLPMYESAKENHGYVSIITCNHDTPRPRRTLSYSELKLAYAFIFTMPGVPFLYYGDEIGMRYLDIPTKEGGYGRTGSRTPMQWSSKKNLGFSEAFPEDIYLPVDSSPDAPTVEAQQQDPDSLLNTVKEILALRHKYSDLNSQNNLEIVYAKKDTLPFIYKRGDLFIAINPSTLKQKADVPTGSSIIYSICRSNSCDVATITDTSITLAPESFVIIK